MNTKEQFIEQEHITEGSPKVYIVANSASEALAAQEKIERKGGMRLTNDMRDSIMSKVYDFKFKKDGEALDKRELRLSHRAMVAVFGKTALEQLEKIGMPYAINGPTDDYGEPDTNAEKIAAWKGVKIGWRVGALGYQYSMRVKDPLPPNRDRSAYRSKFVVKAGALADEIVAWHEACEAWLKAKREMEHKVLAVLNSVTTFNSLQRTWPDGERFWKHLPIDFPFRNQVPAVRVEELNEALGL